MLQNTGAVISIAFVLAIVTSSVDKDTLFAIFSGVTTGLSDATLEPFVSNMHTALWVLAATSRGRRGVSLLRPQGGVMRIGALASAVGTTPRTIRYYEEIGLLARELAAGRCASRVLEADVERLREILRLKALLGLSLDELREVVAREDARARRRRAWAEAT